MESVIVIPARYGSTRLPGKPLALLAGKPMIQHVYERASRARSATRVIVATDDERIRTAVLRFGGEALLTSGAHASGTDRVAEVARDLDCDLVVNIQGDEPMIEPAVVDEAVAPFGLDPGLLMGSLKTHILTEEEFLDPAVVKVVTDSRDDALYFSRSPIPYPRSNGGKWGPSGRFFRHVGIYVYRRGFLQELASMRQTELEKAEGLEQLRALENGHRIRVPTTRHRSLHVDTPEELAAMRRLLEGKEGNGEGKA